MAAFILDGRAGFGRRDRGNAFRNELHNLSSIPRIVLALLSEEWQRIDGEALEFTRDYEIGEQTRLSRVYARNIRCTCVEVVPTEE